MQIPESALALPSVKVIAFPTVSAFCYFKNIYVDAVLVLNWTKKLHWKSARLHEFRMSSQGSSI